MVYIMIKKATETRGVNPLPSDYYYSVLDEGYKTFGFDAKILSEAVREACGRIQPKKS